MVSGSKLNPYSAQNKKRKMRRHTLSTPTESPIYTCYAIFPRPSVQVHSGMCFLFLTEYNWYFMVSNLEFLKQSGKTENMNIGLA